MNKVFLSDVCTLIPGFAFKAQHFNDSDDKVIKITNITPPTVDMTNLSGVDISNYKKDTLSKFIAKTGDYVLAMTGATIGKLGMIKSGTAYVNQRVLLFKPLENKINKSFLFYVLSHPTFNKYIFNHIDSETAQPNISANSVGKYEFDLPDIDVQKKIAGVLSALDDKIELNNQINSNLEQQAQALFKSWFIDFEPFGGKMPNDWEPANVEKAIVLHDSQRIPLSSNQRMSMEKRYPYYGATSIMDFVDNYIFDGKFLLLAEDGTVIDKNDRPVLQYVYGKFWVNNHAHVISGKNGFSVEFLYLFFKQTNIKGFVTGAVQPKINQANLNSIPMNIPTKNILSEFDVIIQPLFNLFIKNNNENQRLSEIRDSLLPKLMSGEIDMSKVDISDLI